MASHWGASDAPEFKRGFQSGMAFRTLVLAPGREGAARVNLGFHCKDFSPPFGRTDTLALAFRKKSGAEGYKDVTFRLPFHVSYRGPVVSILVGLGLLYLFTQLGWLIADS